MCFAAHHPSPYSPTKHLNKKEPTTFHFTGPILSPFSPSNQKKSLPLPFVEKKRPIARGESEQETWIGKVGRLRLALAISGSEYRKQSLAEINCANLALSVSLLLCATQQPKASLLLRTT
jgi:hypothetical protein